jgi:hypothetical protein
MAFEIKDNLSLSQIGYTRVYEGVYRYLWGSPDVEHFLYLDRYGNDLERLKCDFGFRNRGAQKFGLEMVTRYGGSIYKLLKTNDTDCFMRFPFWGIPAAASIKYWRTDDTTAVVQDLNCHIVPFVRSLRDRDALFFLLVDDREPCPWIAVNGAMRAAQIAYLGKILGRDAASINQAVQSRKAYVTRDLEPGSDPDEFLEAVISDAGFVKD